MDERVTELAFHLNLCFFCSNISTSLIFISFIIPKLAAAVSYQNTHFLFATIKKEDSVLRALNRTGIFPCQGHEKE
jgi:hypothetical protein